MEEIDLILYECSNKGRQNMDDVGVILQINDLLNDEADKQNCRTFRLKIRLKLNQPYEFVWMGPHNERVSE